MNAQQTMTEHFATIARVYREVRTTDAEPVLHIREALKGRPSLRAADVGCGAGRYDILLFEHLPGLHLTCVDVNPAMLEELSRHLTEGGHTAFETVVSGAEDLQLGEDTLDCVFTFNAVHHFHLPTFLAKAGRAIHPGGAIFIYTRTPHQNAGSVWGRHFPGFCEKERRLFPLSVLTKAVEESGFLQTRAVATFRYRRVSSLDGLLDQVRNRHYSTLSLYSSEELAEAIAGFEENIRRHYADTGRVEWTDQNLLLQIERAAS